MLTFMAYFTTKGPSLHCCQNPCLRSVVLTEAMLMSTAWASARTMTVSVIHTAAEVHVDAHSLCCCQRPCRGLWHILTLEAMWLSMIYDTRSHMYAYDPADCKQQGGFFCSGTDDCRLTVDTDIEGFCDNPYLHSAHQKTSNNLDRKPS